MTDGVFRARIGPVKAEQVDLRGNRERWKNDPYVHYVPAWEAEGGPPQGESFNLYRTLGHNDHIADLESGDWVVTHEDGFVEVLKDWDFKRKYSAINQEESR